VLVVAFAPTGIGSSIWADPFDVGEHGLGNRQQPSEEVATYVRGFIVART
jgi:hypothetical protein